mmetsp:Transcript_2373/g.2710  ORF Transcript_2373/g.2710 Transcript_2373/m.2710 type:complete len:175 (-) Transcript_2373:678-1202(-)|eukprot:CAMPEP_0184017312 /NCGR_PEP_ID=MMETSP0954-20121128/7459_1 /TAXON_ID=627963 /ORGANISM="Aplanochytrium sp, Strain PBS07" /LENGTH=174 /DNA_ID=CAMNT_0026298519 /DNA_START=202 /DNA_END=726 /DNA_ORIENTATION=+
MTLFLRRLQDDGEIPVVESNNVLELFVIVFVAAALLCILFLVGKECRNRKNVAQDTVSTEVQPVAGRSRRDLLTSKLPHRLYRNPVARAKGNENRFKAPTRKISAQQDKKLKQRGYLSPTGSEGPGERKRRKKQPVPLGVEERNATFAKRPESPPAARVKEDDRKARRFEKLSL